jgi:hypothetical protein
MLQTALMLISCCCSEVSDPVTPRVAIVLTIAGRNKLSEYFDWTCTSIGVSKGLFDLLIFHESNSEIAKRKKNEVCAPNVKFIDLGAGGLVRAIVSLIIDSDSSLQLTNKESTSNELTVALNEVVTNIPRYLVEVKPMIGELLRSHLSAYSHWSYSDPDIVWGNLTDWIDTTELSKYDILTIGKHFDSGRLFLRGQLTIHKNQDRVTTLWRELPYLKFKSFLSRISDALHDIKLKTKESESIFEEHFISAEGYY